MAVSSALLPRPRGDFPLGTSALHAQVAALGYGMYYLWMIRHLPGNPYTGFTFTADHTWTLDPAQQGWRPADSPLGLA